MSSYLNFYLKKKAKDGEEEQYIPLPACFSRNTDVYQSFVYHVGFIGNGDKPNYTTITEDMFFDILSDLQSSIDNCKKNIQLFLNLKNVSTEEVFHEVRQEMLDNQVCLDDYQETYNTIKYIKMLYFDDLNLNGDYNELVANID